MKSGRELALFDFDGTITSRDTLLAFAEFYAGRFHFIAGMFILAPLLLGNKLKLISAQKAKEAFLSYFFRGVDNTKFNNECNVFTAEVLTQIIRPEALKSINDHLTNGTRVVIVSASPENWILPWANQYGIEVLATKLELWNDKLTGKIEGKNCNYEEKRVRIEEEIVLSDYDSIIAYGDSNGDKAMFSLAHQIYFKPFRDKG